MKHLLKIERFSQAQEYGRPDIHGWCAIEKPNDFPGSCGSTPAEALSDFAIDPELARLLDHPDLWGLQQILSNGELQWMAGYADSWFRTPRGCVEWAYASTAVEAVRAARKACPYITEN